MTGDRRPKRLLWLIDSLTVGGAEALTVPFARELDRTRWDLSIACLTAIDGNAIEKRLSETGVEVVNFRSRNLRDLAAFRRFVRFVRGRKIELVHAHLTYAAIWAAVAARVTRLPAVASLHVAPPEGGRDAVRDRLMRFALDRWASRVITVSGALRDDVLRRGGLRSSKTVVVHNGIETGRFERDREAARHRLETELAIPPGRRLAATVSVLRPGKGIDVLIEAAPGIPGVHFLVAGDGPMREEWMRLAEVRGVSDRFHWAGHRDDLDELLAGCDLLVHPSLADAFPTVLLEAMAAGLPVVASRAGGIPEIVVDSVTGSLVPPGDPARLAHAVDVLANDEALRRAMGSAGRDRARQVFSTRSWIERLESVYAEALR